MDKYIDDSTRYGRSHMTRIILISLKELISLDLELLIDDGDFTHRAVYFKCKYSVALVIRL